MKNFIHLPDLIKIDKKIFLLFYLVFAALLVSRSVSLSVLSPLKIYSLEKIFFNHKDINQDSYNKFSLIEKVDIFDTKGIKKVTKKPIKKKDNKNIQYKEIDKIIRDFTLVGTLIIPGNSYALIVSQKHKKRQQAFTFNEEVFNSKIFVEEIHSENVLLRYKDISRELVIQKIGRDLLENIFSDKQTETLIDIESSSNNQINENTENEEQDEFLDENKNQNTASKENIKLDNKELGITNIDDDFIIETKEVDKALNDFASLMRQARVVPHTVGGKVTGFLISRIEKGSIYEKIGLKKGDIIKSVNEQPIDNPQKAFQLFEILKNETQIVVEIERNKETKFINYFIQ